MAVYIITGEQGEGKGIMAMMQIQEALWAGKRVVTNIDLRLENLVSKKHKTRVMRCSDFPSAEELWSLGEGCEGYEEKHFGLIVLDEMGIYLNSRNFKDAGRESFIKWLRHVRKLKWDLMLLSQSAESLDKQIRTGLAHFHVKCKAGDKMTVPLVGPLVKYFTGKKVTLPKFHAGIVKRGFGPGAIKVDTWFTRGTEFYKAYDTMQAYTGDCQGLSTVLCPARTSWLTRPTGFQESMRDTARDFMDRYPKLAWLVPGRFCGPSQDRSRYLDFMVSERDGLPSYKTDSHVTYSEWLSAQISAKSDVADGVQRGVSGETFEPLLEAAE